MAFYDILNADKIYRQVKDKNPRATARVKSIIFTALLGKLYKLAKNAVQTSLFCRFAAIHLLSAGRAFRSGTR